jgi:microcystin-dependent protein
MDEPFVGETRIFAFSFAPDGWLACDGSLLPIGEFESLFQLIGNSYGGDGHTNFAVPQVAGPQSDGTALNVCICLFGAYPSPN